MSFLDKEISRVEKCDEITTKCLVCGKEIKLKFDYTCNDSDTKYCCGHEYTIEIAQIDFVVRKSE